MKAVSSRSPLDALPLMVFLAVGLVAVAARSLPLTAELGAPSMLREGPLAVFAQGHLPVCLRVGATLVYGAYEMLFAVIGRLMMIAPETQPLFIPPPADWPVKWWGASQYFDLFAPTAALYATRLTLLLPVLLAARRLFSAPLAQAGYLAVVLVTIGGTPPVLVSAFFTAMRHVVDWPLGYYNFGHEMLLADFAAVGFVHLLVLALASEQGLRPARVALLAAVGQLFFEHLGFITGIAAGLAALGRGGGWRQALLLVLVAGLASAPVLAVMLALKIFVFAPGGAEAGMAGYFDGKWQSVARQNFLWAKLVVAHLVSLSVFPLLAGLALGFGLRLAGLRPAPGRWRGAAAAALGASLAALAVGSLVSGFFPDLGRQVVYLVSLLPLLAVALAAPRRS